MLHFCSVLPSRAGNHSLCKRWCALLWYVCGVSWRGVSCCVFGAPCVPGVNLGGTCKVAWWSAHHPRIACLFVRLVDRWIDCCLASSQADRRCSTADRAVGIWLTAPLWVASMAGGRTRTSLLPQRMVGCLGSAMRRWWFGRWSKLW